MTILQNCLIGRQLRCLVSVPSITANIRRKAFDRRWVPENTPISATGQFILASSFSPINSGFLQSDSKNIGIQLTPNSDTFAHCLLSQQNSRKSARTGRSALRLNWLRGTKMNGKSLCSIATMSESISTLSNCFLLSKM